MKLIRNVSYNLIFVKRNQEQDFLFTKSVNCDILGDVQKHLLIKFLNIVSLVLLVFSSQYFFFMSLKVEANTPYGQMLSAGSNGSGELGIGNNTNQNTLSTITGQNEVVAVSGGQNFSTALRSDGTVIAWGRNNHRQLGDPDFSSDVNSPRVVPNLTGVVSLKSGRDYTAALKSDGTVYTWGWNGLSQLGRSGNSAIPTQVSQLSSITKVSCGLYHCLALKSDGTVYSWGWNGQDQLGRTGDHGIPAQITTLSNVRDVAAGSYHSLVTTNSGSLYAWGANWDNQALGGGSTPNLISGVTNADKVEAGDVHSLLLKTDGTVSSFGSNSDGQRGRSGGSGVETITGLSSITKITTLNHHNLAINSSGSVFGWGRNDEGQLGLGTNTDVSTPTQISGLSNIVDVGTGHFHSIFLQESEESLASQNNNCDGSTSFEEDINVVLCLSGGSLSLYAGDSTDNNDICSSTDITNSTVVETNSTGSSSTFLTCSQSERNIQFTNLEVTSSRQSSYAVINDVVFQDLRGLNNSNYSVTANISNFTSGNNSIVLGSNPDGVTIDTDPDAPTGNDANKLFVVVNCSVGETNIIRDTEAMASGTSNYVLGSKSVLLSTTQTANILSTTAPVPLGRIDVDNCSLKIRVPGNVTSGNYTSTLTQTISII
jgi:alpha-tubulin suppressor-like RCC1 family protein